MATSLTKGQVYNLALDLVGEFPILPGQVSPYSQWLDRNFDPTVERLIRSYNWNFAREVASLNEDPTAPPFEWSYRFELPSDCLRLLTPREGGYRNGRPIDHEIAGDYLYMNIAGPAKVRYLKRVLEPGRWDALFAAVVQADLALGMANKFTGKNSYVQNLAKLRQDTLDLAKETSAIEGDLPPVDDFDIIRVREV